MKPSRNRLLLAGLLSATAAMVAAGIAHAPAIGQDAPQSILPPGFGDPAPVTPPQQGGSAPSRPTDLMPPATLAPLSTEDALANDSVAEEEKVEPFELPDAARRPVDVVGPIRGFGPDAFGGADGRVLTILMRRMAAPVASRWASITLRRALLTQVPTPSRISPADWVAERAWLLLRMGEADAARMLVQGIDVDRFTPKLYAVAMQTALANADPAGLCPLVAGAPGGSGTAGWAFAGAICASLSGEVATSSLLFDRARRGLDRRGIDVLLAERTIGAGTNSRRAVNIDWAGVDMLTSWRFGLANAVGLAIPTPLIDGAPSRVRAWQARAPMLLASARIGPARTAAALGVLSNMALVDLYGAVGEENDDFGAETPAGRLRAAYVGDDDDARVSAMRILWKDPKGSADRYASLILTARAAARIAPDADFAGDANNLVAAMLSAGLDLAAVRWAGVANAGGAETDGAWATLALASPRPTVEISYGRIDAFADHQGRLKAQMLVAGLAGLGRLSAADAARLTESYAVPIAAANGWTRAINAAAGSGQPATVALLVATGMQAPDWRGVPPSMLYHMVAALRRVGLEGEARMIAAEAIARL